MNRSSPLTILIVEDDEDDRILIDRASRRIGVRGLVRMLNSGFEAIAYLEGREPYADRALHGFPTMILTDLKMLRGDGFMLLNYVKGHSKWAIVPIVILTASTDERDIARSYRLGASAYHVKPPTLPELESQLKMLFDYWLTCAVPQVEAAPVRKFVESGRGMAERMAPSLGRV